MNELAKNRGGKCLSHEYINGRTKLAWICSKDHTWNATPLSIKRGTWCPECYNKRRGNTLKQTINDMHRLAELLGGKCLSKEYDGNDSKLKWLCENGHFFWKTPNSVQQREWCPLCSKDIGPRKKMDKTYKIVIEIIKEKGGECLSRDYVKNHSKLKIRCKYGHEWETAPRQIKKGYWCPICSAKIRGEKSRKYTIDDMIKYAQSKGGECLSTEFKGLNSPLIWKCKKDHIWKNRPSSMFNQQSWCRKCSAIIRGKKRRTPIEVYQEIAQKRGGKLLSTEYINSHTKMEWQCEDGHKFWSVPAPVRFQDVWCPICSSGISERIVREYFKIIFEKDFQKKHPIWLLSPLRKRMELDGYNEELRIAFEYQGEQHYNPIYFGKNKRLKEIQIKDELKKQLCEKNNVTLITIPYYIKRDEFQNYISTECRRKGIQIAQDKPLVDYRTLNVYSPRKIKELQQIAEKFGGKCLSKTYIDCKTPLLWQCSKGHKWWAVPNSIKGNHWCPICSKRKSNYKKFPHQHNF